MTNDVATNAPIIPTRIVGQQDMAEFGTMLANLGYTQDQTRGVVAQLQQIGNQSALAAAAAVVDQMQRLVAQRLAELYRSVEYMSGYGPLVRRDQVLAAIQRTALTRPSN